MALETVLARGRSAFLALEKGSAEKGRVLVAVGNDACDADSIVSSIGLAWWWSARRSQDSSTSSANSSTYASAQDIGTPEIAVALANVPRREFRLRKDAELLFERAGVSSENLIFVDEAAALSGKLPEESNLSDSTVLGITDHNAVTGRISGIFGEDTKVLAVVDHHQDLGMYKDAQVRVLDEGCGSACTLVAEQILSEEGLEVPDELVKMLLGVILLDTRDFDPSAKKYNDRDVRVHKALCERFTSVLPDRAGQTELYNDLIAARGDVEGFSASDLLRLDFKSTTLPGGTFQGSTIGFSSIFDSALGFVERAGADGMTLDEALMEMMNEHNLDALFCLCKATKVPGHDKKKKSVIARARNDQIVPPVVAMLKQVPEGLPGNLADLPLFGADMQNIVNKGFGVIDDPEIVTKAQMPTPDMSTAFHIRRMITRKTFMPTVLTFLETH